MDSEVSLVPVYRNKLVTNPVVVPGLLMSPPEVLVTKIPELDKPNHQNLKIVKII